MQLKGRLTTALTSLNYNIPNNDANWFSLYELLAIILNWYSISVFVIEAIETIRHRRPIYL